MLYWVEKDLATGALKIRRKNLSNGNHVQASFPLVELTQMTIAEPGIAVVGTGANSLAELYRGGF